MGFSFLQLVMENRVEEVASGRLSHLIDRTAKMCLGSEKEHPYHNKEGGWSRKGALTPLYSPRQEVIGSKIQKDGSLKLNLTDGIGRSDPTGGSKQEETNT